MTYIAPIYI